MKKIIGVNVFAFLLLLVCSMGFAQIGPQGYNPNSVRPVLESDIMYRTTVWRRINLLEKQNKPFFSRDNEITAVIIEGVKEGKLQPYEPTYSPRSTGFDSPLDTAAFFSNLEYYDSNIQDTIQVRPIDLFIIEIKEDLIFDRRRSRMYWDIQSVSLVLPQGTGSAMMGDKVIATFKYKDLYEYFKATYDSSQEKGTSEDLRAFWYNPENPKQHKSLADAFDLRLFSSRIFKVANPNDDDIATIVNAEYANDPQAAKKMLYMSQKIEYDLMEFEHNLWEF
jgi:gliding motility associated protien GldN